MFTVIWFLAAAQLLLSLIPSVSIRQQFITYTNVSRHGALPATPRQPINADALPFLHKIMEYLLHLLQTSLRQFMANKTSSNSRLVPFLTALRACLVSQDEKIMLSQQVQSLWAHYEAYHAANERIDPNKQALFLLWFTAAHDCPHMVDASVAAADQKLFHKFMLNFIVYVFLTGVFNFVFVFKN